MTTFPLTRRALSWWARWSEASWREREAIQKTWGLHPDEEIGLGNLEFNLAVDRLSHTSGRRHWFSLTPAGWNERVKPEVLDALLSGVTFGEDVIPDLVRALLPEKYLGNGAPLGGQFYLEKALREYAERKEREMLSDTNLLTISGELDQRCPAWRTGATVPAQVKAAVAAQTGYTLSSVVTALTELRKRGAAAPASNGAGSGPVGSACLTCGGLGMDAPGCPDCGAYVELVPSGRDEAEGQSGDWLTQLRDVEAQFRDMREERDDLDARLRLITADRDNLADRVHALNIEREEWRKRAEDEASRPERVLASIGNHAQLALSISTGCPPTWACEALRDLKVVDRAAVLERAAALCRLAAE